MRQTLTSPRGMVTAPHHLAANSASQVLRDGGNAIEAMVAAAATIAVVYPHMNSIGGDGFWIISEPGQTPIAIDACGRAAGLASIDFYKSKGLNAIPGRGPLSRQHRSGCDFRLAGSAVTFDAHGWQITRCAVVARCHLVCPKRCAGHPKPSQFHHQVFT